VELLGTGVRSDLGRCRADEQGGGLCPPSRPPFGPVPPPHLSADANRPGSPVPCTPEAQAHVELAPSVGFPEGPSESNDQRLRPNASDDAVRRSQGLDQVANQGWVAYFNCHCRCHAPRVAAGEARTSHSRQKRSAVKAATSAEPQPRLTIARRRLLAAPRDAGNPYARELEFAFSCVLAAERVSHSVSPGDPARDYEPRRASRARARSGERAGAPCLGAPRSRPPTCSPGGFRAGVGHR
jgi:hypothetical protein